MEKINFDPLRVYNVDEIGITMVLYNIARVITVKGKKELAAMTAAAGGVFPCKNMIAELWSFGWFNF